MTSPSSPTTRSPIEITERAQRAAADPAASAWVAANAGAGKTHVLVMRLLRLLLAGTPPERILCLTFTKAAAAEMSNRVLSRLADWVTLADHRLAEEIEKLVGRAPLPDELVRARDLFAVAMETPGGLKVQTIHAFCERLLQRFPLEAGVPPNFSVLEDVEASRLRIKATEHVLMDAVEAPDSPLGRAHRLAIAYAAEDGFDRVLRAALARQDLLIAIQREDDALVFNQVLHDALGVPRGTTHAGLDAEFERLFATSPLQPARDVLRGGTKTDQDRAAELDDALGAATLADRIDALESFCIVSAGSSKSSPRKSLMTKALTEANPALVDALAQMQTRFCALHEARAALRVVEATHALVTLADAIAQSYMDLKNSRGLLDFDDLIRHSANLLGDAGTTDWVLYKLDGGLDHILVDEAQDTSPEQWHLVQSLAREFFAGTGARDPVTQPRTVFAVGDEKQSIYGFQGAAPHLFAEVGQAMQRLATDADAPWRNVPLTLSFRTVAPVLAAIDEVFKDPTLTPGVRPGIGVALVEHVSNRRGSAGLVEIWEPEPFEAPAPIEVWSQDIATLPSEPAGRLAARIADTIRGWLDSGEKLISEDRPIRAGDILVLVRKRKPFAGRMVAALQARGIPVAGADRMRLTEQIAVRDLIVLGEFLLLPEDDLALATILKGPFFGLDDDDLLRLAPRRSGTLWSALLRAAAREPRFAAAAETLKRWRARADLVPPYEFFVEVLDHDCMRHHMLTRLGAEAADAIDEFLALALAWDEKTAPSLQGFIHWIGSAEHDVKRDMELARDEVRVMTVHGAKGLEAPIVFLPDTCASAFGPRRLLLDLVDAERPPNMPAPFLWPISGSASVAAVKRAREHAADSEIEEHQRLLYVAMTRARDRLYMAGFEGKKRHKNRWYDLVSESLAPSLVGVESNDARHVRRLETEQTVPPETPRTTADVAHGAELLPDWATRPAPREPVRLIPVAPSRLAPLDTDAEGEPIERARPSRSEPVALGPVSGPSPDRFLRGTVTHALLQYLPGLDPAMWGTAARRFVEVRAASLSPRTREGIVSETLAILTDPAFADLFGPASRAEVPIVAEIAPPGGNPGPNLRITAHIDRLVQLPGRVLIVDYKTNRPPPRLLDAVPEAYLLQLAAYVVATEQIFAPLPVEAALLWTEGPHIMAVPAEMLDAGRKRLFSAQTITVD
jgi:ATP-dependent helicase/nuclease subunit A